MAQALRKHLENFTAHPFLKNLCIYLSGQSKLRNPTNPNARIVALLPKYKSKDEITAVQFSYTLTKGKKLAIYDQGLTPRNNKVYLILKKKLQLNREGIMNTFMQSSWSEFDEYAQWMDNAAVVLVNSEHYLQSTCTCRF